VNILALIPARMDSSRFPGKPMAKILGKPMIGHVYERVSECNLLTKTVVATCDQVIAEYINSIGGQAVMTSDQHERASDRCAEALGYIEKQDGIHMILLLWCKVMSQ
jgi:3-deoxy-manno-octulosonate cytidylyltransferase (CMP-KDO synthetase)